MQRIEAGCANALPSAPTSSNSSTLLTSNGLEGSAVIESNELFKAPQLVTKEEKKTLAMDAFELLAVVGRGTFGGNMLLVKKKEGKDAGYIYMIKILLKADVITKDQVENTKSEQRILKEITHPFIARLRFSFQNADKLYLGMDYYPGGSTFYHLRKSTRFSEERTKFYMAQLLMALMHLHSKQIAYRDLKLENIWIDAHGNVALVDFGLAKGGQTIQGAILESQTNSGMKTMCGTAEYMAPEVLHAKPYSKAVDWWAYGILLFEMLTGRTPFVNRNRRQMFKDILQSEAIYPPYITPMARSLISKLLNRDPSCRLGGGPHGGGDILAHPFFASIDWGQLMRKEIEPPFKPDVSSIDDTTNVADIFRNMEVVDSPVNGENEEDHHIDFEGYSYEGQTTV